MSEVTIKLQRLFGGADSTLGALWLDKHQPACFIIEDEYRAVKVMGETRIDAGRYEIKKRVMPENALSGKTKAYRGYYDWFDFHLELQDVPRHKYVYIHHGNLEKDTDACLLTNYSGNMLEAETYEYSGGRSRVAFEMVYKKIEKMLETTRVFIDVIDEAA